MIIRWLKKLFNVRGEIAWSAGENGNILVWYVQKSLFMRKTIFSHEIGHIAESPTLGGTWGPK